MMKTVAYFSDFTDTLDVEKAWASKIKEETGADRLVAMVSGNYLQNGLPSTESADVRVQRAIDAGVDLALQASLYASLSTIGIYSFSSCRILEHLDKVNEVVLETEGIDQATLVKIAYILIANPRPFQERITKYKKQGRPFYEAQAKAIDDEIPGTEEAMNSWYNIFAVETIKSFKVMYSTIQCVCVPRRSAVKAPCKVTKKLSDYLEYQITRSHHALSDFYGGYESLSTQMLEQRDQFEDFVQFADLCAGASRDVFDIRKYFIRVLTGIKKSLISIWRLYDFSPYCLAHTGDGVKLSDFGSKILLLDKAKIKDMSEQELYDAGLNRSKQELLYLEMQAEYLYKFQMAE